MVERLNQAQKEAVEHLQGPLLVLAGAGSGKTRVITNRIGYLIEQGVRPESILAVSFTNKAAGEMQDRLASMIGPAVSKKVWLSTFHRFGVRFLSEEGAAVELEKRFAIFDQGDSLGLVRDLLRKKRRGQKSLDAASILSRISLWKNRFLDVSQIPDSDFEYDEAAREVFEEYESCLRSMKAVDFDDLVLLPIRVLDSRPDIRQRWQEKFRYVLVDEFQDTNFAQFKLIKLLANSMSNVCVVGDDDQSIYSWRGAEVNNILDFEKHFKGTKVVKLEQNYRCTKPIVEVANAVIQKSVHRRHPKQLISSKISDEPVRVWTAPTMDGEIKLAVSEIRQLVRKRDFQFREVAVLYRSNRFAKFLEQEFRPAGIPYRMLGGSQFYDRKEVKDVLAYLRVVLFPWDELSARRIINYPARAIGAVTVEKISNYGTIHDIPFSRAIGEFDKIQGLSSLARNNLQHFSAALNYARAQTRQGEGFGKVAKELFDTVGMQKDLLDQGVSGRRKWENVEFFLRSIERFEAKQSERGSERPGLKSFLQKISLREEEKEDDTQENKVIFSTLHAAKGLEFPVVFLMGCVEGVLPHSRTTDPKISEAISGDLEEERRLFYVGVTRAKDRLYLTRSRTRTLRGRTQPLTPSRFLEGLPEQWLTEEKPNLKAPLEKEEVIDMTKSILAQLER